MKVVLDVNVLVSATIHQRGISRQILNHIFSHKEFELVISEHILKRAIEVLNRKHIQKKYHEWVTLSQLQSFFALVRRTAFIVGVQSELKVIVDPEDNLVLACAVDGQADYLVSGDEHITDLKEFQGIKIVKPATFLQILDEQYKR